MFIQAVTLRYKFLVYFVHSFIHSPSEFFVIVDLFTPSMKLFWLFIFNVNSYHRFHKTCNTHGLFGN